MSSEIQAVDHFFRTWAQEFRRALEIFGGKALAISEKKVHEIPDFAEGQTLWMKQVFVAAVNFTTWIGLPEATWTGLGQAMGGGSPEILRSTCLEILNQTQQGTATALSSELKQKISVRERELLAPPNFQAAAYTMWLVQIVDGELPPLLLAVEHMAATALEATLEIDSDQQHANDRLEIPPMLDRLLDLELPISVALGRTEMPIKDVLRITSGSVIELDKEVGEPVDLLVHGSVVARGEIVLLKGNYGVRIEEIVSRRDRLNLVRT